MTLPQTKGQFLQRESGNLLRLTGQSMAEPGLIQHLLRAKTYFLSTKSSWLLEGLWKSSEPKGDLI